MTRRRPRELGPEEAALWQQVARTARPLGRGRTPAGSGPEPPRPPDPPGPSGPPAAAAGGAAPPSAPVPGPAPIPPFRIGEKADEAAAGRRPVAAPGARLPAEPLRMDARIFARLARGQLEPEGRIDLHGMTLAEAEPALARFVLGSQAMGRRLVLVITGKGRAPDDGGPVLARKGLLREHVPRWLERPPLSGAVVQALPAHRRHGGEGAFYVLLRRSVSRGSRRPAEG